MLEKIGEEAMDDDAKLMAKADEIFKTIVL